MNENINQSKNIDQIDKLREGKKLLTEHKYEKALKAFDDTLNQNKDNATLWAARGILELKLEYYDKAEDSFRKAIDKDPTDPYYWAGLGYILQIKSEYQEALEAYEKALENGIKFEELLTQHMDTIQE
jgi:tetratricopeptide (TPR) repeat protein